MFTRKATLLGAVCNHERVASEADRLAGEKPDYGAGPRDARFPAAGRPREDGRAGMTAWIFDRSREIATRTEVVVIPARRKR